MQSARPAARADGFTLIELLVVVAVIGILAGILLPALANSKIKAIGAVCLNNQKQIVLGFTLYSSDHNEAILGTLKPEMDTDLSMGGYLRAPDLPILPGTPVNAALDRVFAAMNNSLFMKYVPAHYSHHCPGDTRTKRLKPGQGWAFASYSKMEGMNGTRWSAQQIPHTKITAIQSAATAAAFVEEADPRGYNVATWFLNGPDTPGWVDPLALFHGKWTSFSFLDGHAEGRTWRDPATIKAALDAAKGTHTFFWPNNPDFLWLYHRYPIENWRPIN
jgi:prepilin-type N-terminal cleavage/methylation domain-containing protein/prepilin-type processing-associated H-X9-DG protein